MLKRFAAAAPLLLLAAACIEMESDLTLYLDPDGSITAMIVDRNIRSDLDGQQGLDEERKLLDDVAAGRYDKAVLMDECLPRSVDTRLVRDERPYMVVTSARFRSVDDLFQCLLDGTEEEGQVELIRLDGRNRLVVSISVGLDEDGPPSDPESEVTTHHVDPLPSEDVRFVLSAGEFVEAEGFEIDESGKSARPLDFDQEQLEQIVRKGVLVYSLTWTVPEGY